MADSHKNFSYSTILTAPSPSPTTDTSLVVQSGDGAKFPSVPFNATVWPANQQPISTNAEIVRVTAISTDTFTITRAQESSTARAIQVGDQIAATITAKTLTDRVAKSGDTMAGALSMGGFGITDLLDPTLGTDVANKDYADSVSRSSATKIVGPSSYPYFADYYCDGSGDEVQIQAAITAAAGGSVYIAGGTYDINAAITIPSNTEIFGDGISTLLKAHNGLGGTVNLMENSDTSGGNSGIIIRDLKLDGNYANRTPVVGDERGHNLMFKKVSDSIIKNITSVNATSANISLSQQTTNCIVDSCIIANSYWHGLLIVGTSGGTETKGNTIKGCIVYNNGVQPGAGVGIEISQYAVQNTITGCVSRNNIEGGLHVFYRANYNTIVGNSFYANTSNGISIVDESDHNLISGNIIKDNGNIGVGGTTAFLTRDGIYNIISNNVIYANAGNAIRGTFSKSIIDGNNIYNNGQTLTSSFKHGIYLSLPTDVRIIGNTVAVSGSAGIYTVDAANSVIEGNYCNGNGTQGIMLDISSAGPKDTTICNNSCIGNTAQGILLFKNGQRCTIGNNICRQNATNGIDLRGSTRCVVSGNSVSGNSTHGIILQNDAASNGTNYCIVSNNTSTLNGSTGISESGAADNNTYLANNSRSNTGSNFSTVGASNEIGHNIIT